MEALQRRLATKRAPPSVQETAAKGVLERLLPTHLSAFEFRIMPEGFCGGSSCFSIANINISGGKGPEIMYVLLEP
ncbi:hypothetical protein QJS10_CPB17g01869 [Acorus calamus]|uniref:Uncharacterized protein n=1 Tax=Acorus calamus TaxID=4465 RepID=A0AAV9CW75_ACOCL|nr:hypothetical protein QJS10_CPB17g01869 [Acorus calamus]